MKTINIMLQSIVVASVLLYCTPCIAAPIDSSQYTIIPIRFISNLPVIRVKVNDFYTNLVVDTGTTRVNATLSKPVLDNSSAKYIGVIPDSSMMNYLHQKFPYKKYTIKRITIGDFDLKNITVIEFPGMNFFSDGKTAIPLLLNNGTIGVETLKHYSVIFDYPKKRMILIQGKKSLKEYDVEHWNKVKFFYGKSGAVFTKGTVGHATVNILWDTGNSFATVNKSIAKKLGKVESCPDNVESHDPKCVMLKIANLDIDGKNYGRQTLLVHSSSPEDDISLGWSFLKNHQVYFDFKNRIMAIKTQ